MTVRNGWDGVEQLRDVLRDRLEKYEDRRDGLERFEVFDDARLYGRAFVARNLASWITDVVLDPEESDQVPTDGWEAFRMVGRVAEDWYGDADPTDIPDFKPGAKGVALGKRDEVQDVLDQITRVLETEGPDAENGALKNEGVDDPEQDPVLGPNGEVLDLGRRAPRSADLGNFQMGEVIDADFETMTDENDSDDSGEQLTDDLRAVEDPDADTAPDELVDVDDDGDSPDETTGSDS